MRQVSVILPVYNAQLYIEDAVNSILNQTLTDFDLIVIDDGSTDNSLKILTELASHDARIVLISRENRGLIETLNQAISMVKTDYIARMDADDISLPERLEKQLWYMKKNPELAILGTSYRYMDEHGEVTTKRNTFNKHEDIKASFYFSNPIAHPSVMINYKLLGAEYVYLPEYQTIEDLELWYRLSNRYRIENLPDVLLHYRVLKTSISGSNLDSQINLAATMMCQSDLLSGEQLNTEILKATYNYTVNSSTYSRFFNACLKLNMWNIKHNKVNVFSLFKRSLIAMLLWRRKNIRVD